MQVLGLAPFGLLAFGLHAFALQALGPAPCLLLAFGLEAWALQVRGPAHFALPPVKALQPQHRVRLLNIFAILDCLTYPHSKEVRLSCASLYSWACHARILGCT